MSLIVDGEKIEDAVIYQEVERLRPHYERVFKDKSPEEREAQLLDWSRENVIERVLLRQHAKKHGSDIPQADVQAAFEKIKRELSRDRLATEFGSDDDRQVQEQIELQMKIDRMLEEICGKSSEPSKDAVAQFYEQNKDQFETPEGVRVAHIVKHINGQTDEVAALNTITIARDELNSGATFERLVAKYSDCPDNGGDLGYITRGQMVEEFEDVVFNLGVNQVSDVFRTRFGFHIAKVYDRKAAAVAPLDQVKEQVVRQLKEQIRDQAVDDLLDRLRSEARIEEI
ncbi:MAG: peptidylprolyl isomerase [Planctomycetota bacterium]|jgi:parvulin-like peptidyl-prolyl isomerase